MSTSQTLDEASILTIDAQHMLGSVSSFADQVRHAWSSTQALPRPEVSGKIDSIILFGMGGSALGMHVIQAALRDQLTVPVQIINDYTVPAWVNGNTLAILSSYSGTTEETEAAIPGIMRLTQHIAVITSGGELSDLVTKQGVLGYVIDPKFNPCGQPRMAICYSVFGILGLLQRFGLVNISQTQIDQVCSTMEAVIAACNPQAPQTTNPAKQLVAQLNGKYVWVLASEHLFGAAHVLANQLNENGKCLAGYFALPEANHHLMESLVHPAGLVKQVAAVGLLSKNYHPRNQVRYPITGEVMRQAGVEWNQIDIPAATLLEEVGWVLTFGGFISVYAALLYGNDPSPIPKVDFFKHQLSQVK